jgi:hypothetical protein
MSSWSATASDRTAPAQAGDIGLGHDTQLEPPRLRQIALISAHRIHRSMGVAGESPGAPACHATPTRNVEDAMVAPSEKLTVDGREIWPGLPLAEWRDTHDTLHMWMQIVGKTRLALAPKQNHWWHVPLYLGARGLTSTPIPYGLRAFEVEFDFIDHRLIVKTSDGAIRDIALRPRAVADFYREYMDLLATLGIAVKLWPVPVEVERAIPFLEDHLHASYNEAHARRFFQVLLHADRIMKRFQGRFLGKSSPVHFFWGVCDLALTRFSGRRAPEHKDTESPVIREANSHEEISVGFWPGSGTVAEAAFYAYARPEPSALPARSVRPTSAYYSRELADFILPYESVRSLASPDETVVDFFQSVYDAAADLARWDRAALDRPPAEWS